MRSLIRRAAVAAGAAVAVVGLAVPAVALSPASASSLSAHKAGPSSLSAHKPGPLGLLRHPGIGRSSVPSGLRSAVRKVLSVNESPAQKLTASDGVANDLFGYWLAVSGSTAVVGAPGHNGNTGAAYVFVHTATGWSQQAELTASDGAA